MFKKIINITKGPLTIDTYRIEAGESIIVDLNEMSEEFLASYRHLQSINFIRVFDVEPPAPAPEPTYTTKPIVEEPEVRTTKPKSTRKKRR